MASRFSAADVAALSREQKIEALGIALRLKAAHIPWSKGGKVMTDQECLDEAIDYELNPSASSPQRRFKLVDGWAEEDALNPYRWRNRSWLYRFWKVDPLPTSAEYAPLRRAKPWMLNPVWDVPWAAQGGAVPTCRSSRSDRPPPGEDAVGGGRLFKPPVRMSMHLPGAEPLLLTKGLPVASQRYRPDLLWLGSTFAMSLGAARRSWPLAI